MMLIIYSRMALGGIETFYLRLARARNKLGMKTRFLLVSKRSSNDPELLRELMKCAEVFFLEDLLSSSMWSRLPLRALLVFQLNKDRLHEIFKGVSYAHTSSSIYVLFLCRLLSIVQKKIPISIGVYHSKEFISTSGGHMPFYEKIDREVFSSMLKKRQVVFFNDRLPLAFSEYYDFDASALTVFPLGVIDEDKKSNYSIRAERLPVRIISIGRLVRFKSYNSWMLDVVKELSNHTDVIYDIYGDGPMRLELQEKINRLGISEFVSLKGDLPYEKFTEVISGYDIFLGSGTAIVEAAHIGIPSIVGIESCNFPLSYGFISDIPGFTYNEDGLYEKLPVVDIILNFVNLDRVAKLALSDRHKFWANQFSINKCTYNFEFFGSRLRPACSLHKGLISRIAYTVSLISVIFYNRFVRKTEFDRYS